MKAHLNAEEELITEQKSDEFLDKKEQQNYWDVVNLIAKMIVDQTLSHDDYDDEKGDPLPTVQQ